MKERFLRLWKETILLGIILLLITIVVRLICYQIFGQGYVCFYDTKSYSYLEEYEAGFGEIDSFRTPVYPNFIRFAGLFGDDSTDEVYARVAAMQEIISLVSVAVFFLLMKKLTKNKITQSLATLFYGCLPSIFNYNLCILTESLSISFMVFFLYALFCYLEKKEIRWQIVLSILTIFLIFLRPAFLYLLIFFAIFWILQFFFAKEDRKKTGIGALMTLAICGIILGYSYANQVQNGVKGLSYVNIINQTDIIIDRRLYGSYENDPVDDQITQMIVDNYNPDESPWYSVKEKILEKYSYEELDQYNKKCIKHNLKSYLVGRARSFVEQGSFSINTVLINKPNSRLQSYLIAFSRCIYPLTTGFLFIVICLEVIRFLWERIKKETWMVKEQMRFFTMILLAGLLAVTLIGAQAEYERLLSPVLSASILLIARYIEKIWRKREEKDS